MRDIFVTLVVLGSLPYILKRPYIGILVWAWLSYMNPHRFTWGFAYDAPFAQIVAITLLLALLFNREKRTFPFSATTVIWLTLIAWMGVTTIFAYFPDAAFTQYTKILKIQFLTFLTLLLITDQEKLDKLLWVIACSLGFFSVKGGLFTILTGGQWRVYGPSGSYIEENNALALATLMVIPLMVYLFTISKHTWIRLFTACAVALSFASVLGSQSRGALLAIGCVLIFFWLKTRTKFLSGIAIVVFAVVGWNFMPESWHQRMDTIQHYEEDASAMGRIDAWTHSIRVANDNITGAGMQAWRPEIFARYGTNAELVVAAHSIYFSMLGDHGWIGLSLFILILFLTWRKLAWIIKVTANQASEKNTNLLARMLQISLVAYMSGGAFLSLAYFDLPWHIIAFVVLLAHWQQIRLQQSGQVHMGGGRIAARSGSSKLVRRGAF